MVRGKTLTKSLEPEELAPAVSWPLEPIVTGGEGAKDSDGWEEGRVRERIGRSGFGMRVGLWSEGGTERWREGSRV